jgi:predicted kinase
MSKQRLYLFVGYPGAGKTTVSRIIQAKTGAVHLWADHERQTMFGKAKLSDNETTQLYDHLNDMTDTLLGEGKNVIFDTNFNFYKDREYLRQLAAKHGAEIVLVWLQTPIDIARERATQQADGRDTRVWGNMPLDDFARISDNLQAPIDSERPIILDGSHLNEQIVSSKLTL